MATAPADGYTVLLANSGHAILGTLNKNLPFDPVGDFAGVSLIGDAPTLVNVAPSLGVRSLREFVDLAKAKPGTINYGSAGIGTATHLAGAYFALQTGTELVHVPYTVSSTIIADLLGGRIQATFAPAAFTLPLLQDGRLLALAVAADEPIREPIAVPTALSADIDYQNATWYGFLAPAKTPRAVLQALHDAIVEVGTGPRAARRRSSVQGITPQSIGLRDFDAHIRKDMDRLAPLLTDHCADRIETPHQEKPMRGLLIELRARTTGAVGLLLIALGSALAQTPQPALRGSIVSDREGVMEGVVVSARQAGSTITVSVVSDAKGDYSFPASRLPPGRYELTTRAAGYVLDGGRTVERAAGESSLADIKLKPTNELADQLTNAEWMASAPGDDDLKRLMLNCTDCHSVRRIFDSRHTAADFLKVFDRMAGYYPGASDLQPQRLIGAHRRPPLPAGTEQKFAEYLAGINLSARSAHPFELKSFPRPSGRATKVIVTEYDLPRKEIQPHDVIVDPNGVVWYSHFGEQFLSKLDPRTGKVTDFPIPVQKPGYPIGTLDLELDESGDIWVGLMYQTGVAKFDRASETFRILSHSQGMAARCHSAVAFLGGGKQGRRESLGQELGQVAGHAA